MVSQLLLPTRLATRLFNWFCSKVKCSISNVRGVDKDLHYNKVLCESMAGFVPPPNGVPFGIVKETILPTFYLIYFQRNRYLFLS